jgi:HlyD family secretion protein
VLYNGQSSKDQYTTATVDRADIQSSITTTGSCNAVVTVQVGSQVSGNILAIYADFNSTVKKGQLVARIDPAIFQARVDQLSATVSGATAAIVTARAQVKKAEVDIANAQANIAAQKANVIKAQSAVADAKSKNARRIELVKQGVIAQEDADTAQATYDQAVASLDAANAEVHAAETAANAALAQREVTQTQLAGAETQVQQAIASLKQAQLDLAHTEIRAPVDGIVVARNMDVGQTVAASFQAPTIFLIAQDLTKIQVDTNVDESDVGPVREGQRADFTVDAYPGLVFPGVVSQIRQSPIKVQNVVTYDVVVKVANPDLKLFPGMTANVKIVTGGAQGALRLPMAALRYRPANAPRTSSSGGKGQSVYVLQNGRAVPARVTLGINDGRFIQGLSGLTEGQQVVLTSTAKPAPAPASSPVAGSQRRIGF